MNEVKELTVSQEKARTACINAYNKALAKCENATWLVAETIYKTVNREDFKELFGTKKNYAVAINLSCATVTKMESAYKRKLILNDTYTATQIAEMGKVEDEDLTDFVASCEVSPEDSCKTIRQKADVYVADMVEEEEAKNIYARFYCYDGQERCNLYDIPISESQMNRIIDIINNG